MIVKLNDLKKGMMVIYKINYLDGHFYIGFTNDLQRRMCEHCNGWKKEGYRKVQDCDIAIHEQGGLTEVEILEFISEVNQLEEREFYWIDFYDAYKSPMGYNNTPSGNNTACFGEDNSVSVFSNAEVLDIRKRRYNGERKKDVYENYKSRNFATFERVWLGRGYTDVGQEYLIQSNTISRQKYSHLANDGLNNGRAKCTREQILTIRDRYDNGEKFIDIAKDYPHISKSTVRRIAIRESYKSVK